MMFAASSHIRRAPQLGQRPLCLHEKGEHRRRVERAKHLAPGTRTANVRRAIKLDSAIQRAFRDELPVQVIVCDGGKRDIGDVASRDPSRVERRLLDPSPWHVTAYDNPTGKAVLVRDRHLDPMQS